MSTFLLSFNFQKEFSEFLKNKFPKFWAPINLLAFQFIHQLKEIRFNISLKRFTQYFICYNWLKRILGLMKFSQTSVNTVNAVKVNQCWLTKVKLNSKSQLSQILTKLCKIIHQIEVYKIRIFNLPSIWIDNDWRW